MGERSDDGPRPRRRLCGQRCEASRRLRIPDLSLATLSRRPVASWPDDGPRHPRWPFRLRVWHQQCGPDRGQQSRAGRFHARVPMARRNDDRPRRSSRVSVQRRVGHQPCGPGRRQQLRQRRHHACGPLGERRSPRPRELGRSGCDRVRHQRSRSGRWDQLLRRRSIAPVPVAGWRDDGTPDPRRFRRPGLRHQRGPSGGRRPIPLRTRRDGRGTAGGHGVLCCRHRAGRGDLRVLSSAPELPTAQEPKPNPA